MTRYFLLAAIGTLLLLTGCSKDPGEGGRAEIRGVVYEQRYNGSNPVGQPYPVAEQRVYIIYGNGDFADDDTRTGPNGEFRFPWLRKGEYQLYAIGECQNCPSGSEGVYVDVKITGRKSITAADTIFIRNY